MGNFFLPFLLQHPILVSSLSYTMDLQWNCLILKVLEIKSRILCSLSKCSVTESARWQSLSFKPQPSPCGTVERAACQLASKTLAYSEVLRRH